MKAYLLCILLTFILNFFSEFIFKKRLKMISKLLLILSLFLVCFIAGVRTIYVGVDVRGYLLRIVSVAEQYNNIFLYLKNINTEPLFGLLVYFSYLSKNIHITMFLIELAVALPIYIFAYKNRNKIPYTITIFIFLLSIYTLSLSMMRQSIAISLFILGYSYLIENQNKKAYMCLIIGTLFHYSAIIFFVIYFYINYVKKNKKNFIVSILALCILIIMYPVLGKIIGMTKYSSYLFASARGFSILSIIKKFLFVVIWILLLKHDKNNKNKLLGFMLATIACIFNIYSFKYSGVGRLGYYLTDLMYMLLAIELKNSFKQKKFVILLFLVVLSLFWWNTTNNDNDQTGVYPYKSDIVNFLNEER